MSACPYREALKSAAPYRSTAHSNRPLCPYELLVRMALPSVQFVSGRRDETGKRPGSGNHWSPAYTVRMRELQAVHILRSRLTSIDKLEDRALVEKVHVALDIAKGEKCQFSEMGIEKLPTLTSAPLPALSESESDF